MPRVPTLPWDQDSKAGQWLPLCRLMVQLAAHVQGTLAVGSGPSPSPYTPAPCPGVGWQPWWSAAFLRGRGAKPQLLQLVSGLQPEREGTMAAPVHLAGEQGALSSPLAGVQQGGLVRTPGPTKAG